MTEALQPRERRAGGDGDAVAPGVRRFGDPVVNWYLVEGDDGLTAIDAGFPSAWRQLRGWLERSGRALAELRAVVLTHGHIDHIGFAARARRELGVPVHVHERDAPLLTSPLHVARSERSPLFYSRHAATRLLLWRGVRTGAPLAKRVRDPTSFGDGETLAVPGRPRVVHCAGHTEGHCALLLEDRGVLLVGDALVTRDPYTGRLGPRLVARAATADVARNLESLDRIAATGARLLLPGHGEPWSGDAAEAVALARRAGAA